MINNLPIAVIITTFNSERFINDAIQSVMRQSILPEEIIVIDNGSSDTTESIVKGLGISFQVQTTGQVGASRNLGIKLTKSPFIKFLDADDLLEINALELLYNASLASSSDFIYGKIINFVDPIIDNSKLNSKRFIHTQSPLYSMVTLSSLVAREVFTQYGLPESDNQSWNRWYIVARSKRMAISRIDAIIGKRRIHDSNISHDKTAKSELFNWIALKMKSEDA